MSSAASDSGRTAAALSSSRWRARSRSRSTSSTAALATDMGPTGSRQGNSRSLPTPPQPKGAGSSVGASPSTTLPLASAICLGCGSKPSRPTSAQNMTPFFTWTVQSGPTRASSSLSSRTGAHCPPPPPGGPQAPRPVPRSARTTPSVSMAMGTSSAERPSQRSRAPELSGSRPAERWTCVLTSSSRYSRKSSSPSAGGSAPGRKTARSSEPRAASATPWPGSEEMQRGSPVALYRRRNLRDVSAATKPSPQAMASGASSALPKKAEKLAFSQRSAGRISNRDPPLAPAPAARQLMLLEIAPISRPAWSTTFWGFSWAWWCTSMRWCSECRTRWPWSFQAR
mmetsp:Transcript_90058/g.232442  ORF Transcript_90058/g.232442 Transcript_90058/m.232442 type:complete len:341 (-) Transcript_90058:298-1320(-)